MEIHNDVKRFIQHSVKELSSFRKKDIQRIFTKIEISQGNIYLIYNNKITIILDNISNYEIDPVGFIFESETGEYIYYNFNDDYSQSREIVKSFVENCL